MTGGQCSAVGCKTDLDQEGSRGICFVTVDRDLQIDLCFCMKHAKAFGMAWTSTVVNRFDTDSSSFYVELTQDQQRRFLSIALQHAVVDLLENATLRRDTDVD